MPKEEFPKKEPEKEEKMEQSKKEILELLSREFHLKGGLQKAETLFKTTEELIGPEKAIGFLRAVNFIAHSSGGDYSRILSEFPEDIKGDLLEIIRQIDRFGTINEEGVDVESVAKQEKAKRKEEKLIVPSEQEVSAYGKNSEHSKESLGLNDEQYKYLQRLLIKRDEWSKSLNKYVWEKSKQYLSSGETQPDTEVLIAEWIKEQE